MAVGSGLTGVPARLAAALRILPSQAGFLLNEAVLASNP
jgi:hypothetical protein